MAGLLMADSQGLDDIGQAGGGIVADSEVDAEYQETFDKISRVVTRREVLRKTHFSED